MRRSARISSPRFACLRVSHLPKHFEETELKKYFGQFGPVHGVYVPRSIKSLRPKGLALVLVNKEAASIIATTVHNVLNFNRIMKCEIVDSYDPLIFTRKSRQVTNAMKEKRRRLKDAVKSSSKTARGKTAPGAHRRISSFRNRIAALKKKLPNYEFQKVET
uniref:MKI67 FHA domain-interacting nucleolar phosphoprotein-like n=1 Tax=Schistocephalus solidus TaxID=70667 RepID=A0A0X3PAF2_SCHSO